MWTCGSCSQENEPQFDNCWSCQAEAPPEEFRQLAAAAPPPPAPALRPPQPVGVGLLIGRSLFDCFLAGTLPFICVSFGLTVLAGPKNLALVVVYLLFYPSLVGVAIWRRRRMQRANEPLDPLWKEELGFPLVAGLGVGGLMAIMSHFYCRSFLPSRPYEDPTGADAASMIGDLVTIVMAVGVGPICEEIFFRGSMLGGFSAARRPGLGLVLSSALFAAAHFSMLKLPMYAAAGLLLGMVCLNTRSILAPIVAHVTNNALLLAVAGFGDGMP